MKQEVLTSIWPLMNALQKGGDIPAQTEALYMDLMESVVRHMAITAIAAYKHCGCKSDTINREIAKQLPFPTFGSWKNIVQMLAGAEKTYFPDNFYESYLAILTQKIKDITINRAYSRVAQLIEFATTEKKEVCFEDKPAQCTYLQFLDTIVAYRNRFKGHGTSNMPDYLRDSVAILQEGVVTFCNHLSPLWLNYPIYLSHKGSLAGESFHYLRPLLVSGGTEIETTASIVKENQLYVCLDKKNHKVETLFPLAIWHDDDIMFYNGTKDFKNTLYYGFNAIESTFGTDKFERQFCTYYLSFLGLHTLDTIDLSENRTWQHVLDLTKREWKFPKLKKVMVIGNYKSKQYILERKIHECMVSEVWKAEVAPGDNEYVAIKFLYNLQHIDRFFREARILRKLSLMSGNVPKYHAFLFEPHPSLQVPYIVIEYLSDKSLETIASEGRYIDVQETLLWIEKSLEALTPIQKNHMVHRNINPATLIFDTQGNIKLGDMGLMGYSEAEQPELFTEIKPVKSEEAVGVIEFASPEQLENKEVGNGITSKSDLFSLGASFYHLLTGQYPYGTGSSAIVVKNQTNVNAYSGNAYRIQPITDFIPECPEFLNRLLLRLLHVDPDLRPDAEAIRSEIQEYRHSKVVEKKNLNCNILGDLEQTDIRFQGLMPAWLTNYMLKVWPIFLFVEILFAASLSLKLDVATTLDIRKFIDTTLVFNTFPLIKDKVYFAWHLMPMLFIVFLRRIIKSVQPIMKEIFLLDHNKQGEHWIKSKKRNDAWSRVMHNRWVFAVIFAIAVFQCYTTYSKALTSIDTRIFYWSDWRVSILTFLSKECLVFINTLGVLYYLIFITALIDLFSYILRGTKLHLDLFNSDNQSGLSCVRRLLLLFLPFFLIFSYGLSIILIADFGQNTLHSIEHFGGIVVITVLYLFFIFWPVYPIHMYIRWTRDIELSLFRKRRMTTEGNLKKYLIDEGSLTVEQTSNLLSLSALKKELLIQESATQRLHVWPINKSAIAMLIAMGILPLLFSSCFLLRAFYR